MVKKGVRAFLTAQCIFERAMLLSLFRAGMQSILGDQSRIIRTMPNTPAMIGEGMTVWSQSSEVTEAQHALVRFNSFLHRNAVR